MLTQLKVAGPRTAADPLLLNFSSLIETDPIQVKGIDGLEPVKADILTNPQGVNDGEDYTGSSVGGRNIVLKLGLNPDWEVQTMAELRKQLYRYFMPKMAVNCEFDSTHLPTCEIDGYVESIQPNIFAKDPEVLASIICPNPHFTAIDEVTRDGLTSDGTALSTTFEYEGSVPTGFVLWVTKNTADFSGQVVIDSEPEDGGPYLDQFRVTGININSAKALYLSTIPGDKKVYELDPASPLLSAINNRLANRLGDIWPTLQVGTNRIRVTAGTADAQAWSITYKPKFGGL